MNFRQYRPSNVVQAAEVVQVDIVGGKVAVLDAGGSPVVMALPVAEKTGDRIPMPGDWLLLHETGRKEFMAADDFLAGWNQVGGPVLQ